MKRHLFFILLMGLCATLRMGAQEQTATDSLHTSTDQPHMQLLPDATGTADGFLMDMSLIDLTPRPQHLSLKDFKLEVPDASKDYNWIFRPNNDVIYSSGLSDMFTNRSGWTYGSSLWGGLSWGRPMDNLQMGSFKLNNGWRLNTYGEYDADGRRVYNPSALPWEKNDFKGAFELKNDNGSFGIRIEIRNDHNGMGPFTPHR